ncbi:uncharacterized protein LOC129791261 [Lutzomyia longipalpis]|uniref:uncharacterized protein LOC129791261 n=1 Tax=Lutzomyia longipalpis TaxID=7200 RepID=UPI0024841535|nr:uncharacterized protein LOC129791261 [Lutzomyia longipalpis]
MPNKHVRSGYKGSLTNIKNALDRLEESPQNLRRLGVRKDLEVHLESLSKLIPKFQCIQRVIIEEQQTEEDRESEQAELIAFLSECDAVEKRLIDHIADIRLRQEASTMQSGSFSGTSAGTPLLCEMMREERRAQETALERILKQQQENLVALLGNFSHAPAPQVVVSSAEGAQGFSQGGIKLEAIKIPTFDGQYVNWQSFQDLFGSIVDENSTLSNAQKMHYLKNALVGEAKAVIEHIAARGENYAEAWEAVKGRYDHKVSILNSLLETFHKQPGVKGTSAAELRKLHDTSRSILNSIKSMQVSGPDPWIIHVIFEKLDHETRSLWIRENNDPSRIPTWECFDKFLSKRCTALEMCPPVKQSVPSNNLKKPPIKPSAKNQVTHMSAINENRDLCPVCSKTNHKLFRCNKFKSFTAVKRLEVVRNLKLCLNCIADSHEINACTYPPCKHCKQKHNYWVHDALVGGVGSTTSHVLQMGESSRSVNGNSSFGSQGEVLLTSSTNCGVMKELKNRRVLLKTAQILVYDVHGKPHVCRAFIDEGSQGDFISERMCEILGLKRHPINEIVNGLEHQRSSPRFAVETTIASRFTGKPYALWCRVVDKVCANLPNWPVQKKDLRIPSGFELADPLWYESGKVDLLIGGYILNDILHDRSHKLGQGLPALRGSEFGWLVFGSWNQQPIHTSTVGSYEITCNLSTLASIDNGLRKFFELEAIPNCESLSEEQEEVENHYVATTKRTEEGRYEVELPLRSDYTQLENNRWKAMQMLKAVKRRLAGDPELRTEYGKIFEEYLKLGFIEIVPAEEIHRPAYYAPHHCVIRKQATSTKTLIAAAHRDFLRFLWEETPDGPVVDYRFRSVCFGNAASPYLATRSLNQLAQDEGHKYPKAAEVVRNNIYVDDCLMSAPTVQEVIETQRQLIEMFRTAKLELSKWQSNSAQVLEALNSDQENHEPIQLSGDEVKTLGLSWYPLADVFRFTVAEDLDPTMTTKRTMMSVIARIFDPIGLIGPIVLQAKMLLQKVWKENLDWDTPVEGSILKEWTSFISNLPAVQDIRIPRWAATIAISVEDQLHVFCDASLLAYGAVIYLVSRDSEGNRSSCMLTSKCKVTPIKGESKKNKVEKEAQDPEVTVPKLELCAAKLGAQLMERVRTVYDIKPESCYYWSDAMVVLGQIHSKYENKQEVFVRNRVKDIRARSAPSHWRHVSTHENPADILSRGTTPKKLQESQLWWNGPKWLLGGEEAWPAPYHQILQEDSHVLTMAAATDQAVAEESSAGADAFTFILETATDWPHAKKLAAFAIRENCDESFDAEKVNNAEFSITELREAEDYLIKENQKANLSDVFQAIKESKINKFKHYKFLRSLCPFIDNEGVIRVRGRLQESEEEYNAIHPRLLPKGRLAKLIAQHEHLSLQHAGPELLFASLRRKYWPIGGRNLAQQIYRTCHVCYMMRPKAEEQLMANLPAARVTLVRPFRSVAMDFAGPFHIRVDLLRGTRSHKAYLCIFVCMAVKAVHIEVVSALTTEAFLAAFRRFVSRRRRPSQVYADNGRNFVGAEREIKLLFQQEEAQRIIKSATCDDEIEWHFQTPSAPHHGGLHEAAVKSTKYHLKRVVGEVILNYEEFTTIVTQVEATLNSRPLTYASGSPADPQPLTPGHFLALGPMNALPDPDLSELKVGKLNRWQLCQKIHQDFTKRWRQEYLHSLQQRLKWTDVKENLKEGDWVVLMENDLASATWMMGQITKIFEGKDGMVRTVEVKTKKGTYIRPITKLARYPKERIWGSPTQLPPPEC